MTMRRPVERPRSAARMGTLGASSPRSAKPGFVGRVGTIGNEALEDAFGDFRTFYVAFACRTYLRPLLECSGPRAHARLGAHRRPSPCRRSSNYERSRHAAGARRRIQLGVPIRCFANRSRSSFRPRRFRPRSLIEPAQQAAVQKKQLVANLLGGRAPPSKEWRAVGELGSVWRVALARGAF